MTDFDLQFKGTLLSSFGAFVMEQPRYETGAERRTGLPVPGRSGTLHMTEGALVLDNIQMQCTIGIPPSVDRKALGNWLRGAGAVIFGNDVNYSYNAVVSGGLILTAILDGTEWDSVPVTFDCEPFRYQAAPAADITVAVSGTALTNPGTVYSEPKITITGTGNVTLTIGLQTVDLAFGEAASVIVLDSAAQMAFNTEETVSRDGDVSGEFPTLPAGAFTVAWAGTVTGMVIKPRWRWI